MAAIIIVGAFELGLVFALPKASIWMSAGCA